MDKGDEMLLTKIVTATLVVLTLVGFMADYAQSQAPNPPLPDEQWTQEAHKWLSRGVVGEAGFRKEDDHAAIAYVLTRRWEKLAEKVPEATFLGMTREYMAGMGVNLKRMTRRTHYIRHLPYAMPSTWQPLAIIEAEQGWEGVMGAVPPPPQWPGEHIKWSKWSRAWDMVLIRMQHWANGHVPDKCPTAVHWGARTGVDRARAVRAGWIEVDCGDTANAFYYVPAKKASPTRLTL